MQHVVYVEFAGIVYPKPNVHIQCYERTQTHIHNNIPNSVALVIQLRTKEINKGRGKKLFLDCGGG
jgi:hypothetical protein